MNGERDGRSRLGVRGLPAWYERGCTDRNIDELHQWYEAEAAGKNPPPLPPSWRDGEPSQEEIEWTVKVIRGQLYFDRPELSNQDAFQLAREMAVHRAPALSCVHYTQCQREAMLRQGISHYVIELRAIKEVLDAFIAATDPQMKDRGAQAGL